MGDGIEPAASGSSNSSSLLDTSVGSGAPVAAADAAPREHFIGTAITFLQNPGVRRNPLNQKQQFLRSKGLTEDEIQIACERAGVFGGGGSADPTGAGGGSSSTVINMGIRPSVASAGAVGHATMPAKSLLQHVRDVVSASALVAGVAYALYMFYKNYIRPWLFGRDSDGTASSSSAAAARKRRRKTPEELMEDMSRSVEKSVASINQELQRVKEEVARTARQDALHREIGTFKADLDAIKGLLLNPKQFTSPVLPPSIPAWQLQVQQQHQLQATASAHQQKQAITTIAAEPLLPHDDDIEEIASGSGSSETEVVNKNSDSSIELI